jgi:predicted Zn-dependent protease
LGRAAHPDRVYSEPVTVPGVPHPQESQWADDLPRWLVVIPIIFIAGLVAAYIYGIPMLAGAVAQRLPAAVAESLSTATLASLDRDVLQPSAVLRERRQEIQSKFHALKMSNGSASAYRLEFRKSDEIGANAMALPSGIIVVTDGLVALARDDREILGVLAHEAGHVEHKHGLRGILQNSLMGMVIAWLVGDVSSIAAAAPAALLEASYSRELEREADAFAIEVLRANGIPLRHLADMLKRLESASGSSGTMSALRYLSTHPATAERIAQLEAN